MASREERQRDAQRLARQKAGQMRERAGTPVQGPTLRERAQSFAGGAGQAFAQGWFDELAGAVMSQVTGEPYVVERNRIRRALSNLQQQDPTMYMAGGLTSGAGFGGYAASRLGPMITAGQRLPTGVAAGAALGTAAGVGEAPTMAQAPEYATTGATLGGGMGLLAPLVVGGGRYAVGRAMDRPPRGPSDEQFAQRERQRMIEESQYSPEELSERFERFGPGTTTADVLGEAGGTELRRVTTEGPARAFSRDFLRRRQDVERDVVREEAAEAMGIPFDPREMHQRLLAQRAEAAGPRFTAAEAQPVAITPELQSLLDRPAIRSAYRNAKARAVNTGEPLPDDRIDFRTLKEIKESLDTKVNNLARRGRGNADFRSMRDLRDEFRQYLRDTNEPYREALEFYEGDTAMLDAYEEGKGILKPAVDSRDVAEAFENLSAGERMSYRMGALEAVNVRMRNLRESGGAAADFVNENLQEKMDVLARTDEAAMRFADRMRGVQQRRQTKTLAEGGPGTAGDLQAGMNRLERLQAFRRGVDTATKVRGRSALDILFDVGEQVFKRRNIDVTPSQKKSIARALLSQDRGEVVGAVNAVANRRLRGRQLQRWSRPIVNALIGAAANPTVVQRAMGAEPLEVE